jgi:hypothetical protein
MVSAKKKPEQQVIYELVRHDAGYPDSHKPLHAREDNCHGCAEFKFRRGRNHRAGKSVGVAIRGESPDEPSGNCKSCGTPAYAAMSGTATAWAWNFDVDRAHWAVEERAKTHPSTLCPRCRPKAEAGA